MVLVLKFTGSVYWNFRPVSYTHLDVYKRQVSVVEAINHACWEFSLKSNIHWIDAEDLERDERVLEEFSEIDAIIVPQGWGAESAEGRIKAIRYARENKIPFLGLCYGMQMATIEYARNVLGIEDANSEEVNPKSKNHIIHLIEDQEGLVKNQEYEDAIRLGAWPCKIDKGSLTYRLYKKYG